MQTFTVKVTGTELSAKDIREFIWQCSEKSREEISVEEHDKNKTT